MFFKNMLLTHSKRASFFTLAMLLASYTVIAFSNFLQLSQRNNKSILSDHLDAVFFATLIGALLISSSFRITVIWWRKTQSKLTDILLIVIAFSVHIAFIQFIFPYLIGPDILHMLHMAKKFSMSDKYTFLANSFILTSLSFDTTYLGLWISLGLIILNAMLLLLIVTNRLEFNIFKKSTLFFSIFLWPYFVFMAAYMNRDTLFGVCFLTLVLFASFMLTSEKKSQSMALFLAALIGSISILRTEALIMWPFLILASYFIVKDRKLAVIVGITSASLIMVVSALKNPIFTSYKEHSTYTATAYLNPLTYILAHPDRMNPLSENDAAIIYSVIDKEKIRYDVGNINLKFNGGFDKSAYNKIQNQFDSTALKVMVQNPELFIENRIRVFLGTMGIGENEPLFPLARTNLIVKSEFLTNSVSEEVVLKTRRSAAKLATLNPVSPTSYFLWNMIPVMIIQLVIIFLFRRSPVSALICTAQFSRAGLVFLTAPATFTYYYVTFQVALPAILLLLYIEQKQNRQKRT